MQATVTEKYFLEERFADFISAVFRDSKLARKSVALKKIY